MWCVELEVRGTRYTEEPGYKHMLQLRFALCTTIPPGPSHVVGVGAPGLALPPGGDVGLARPRLAEEAAQHVGVELLAEDERRIADRRGQLQPRTWSGADAR